MVDKTLVISTMKIIIAVLILQACTSTNTLSTQESYPPSITDEPYPAWLINLLENPICFAPCWENIVPGKTTLQEAKTMLSKIPGISSVEELPVGNLHSVDRLDSLQWSFGFIYLDRQGKVSEVNLHLPYTNNHLNYLIDHFGAPKELLVQRKCIEMCIDIVDLVYKENGLVINLIVGGYGSSDAIKFDISPFQKADSIQFFTPDLQYYYSNQLFPIVIYNWKGYTTYP